MLIGTCLIVKKPIKKLHLSHFVCIHWWELIVTLGWSLFDVCKKTAFWKKWTVLDIPEGIQVFLLSFKVTTYTPSSGKSICSGSLFMHVLSSIFPCLSWSKKAFNYQLLVQNLFEKLVYKCCINQLTSL